MLFRIMKRDHDRELAGEFFGPANTPPAQIESKARDVLQANGFGRGRYFITKWYDYDHEDGGWASLPPFEVHDEPS